MSKRTVKDALKEHLARPEAPETARAFFDEVNKTAPADADAAIHEALAELPSPPPAPPNVIPAPVPAPVEEILGTQVAPLAGGPISESPPNLNWATNMPLNGAVAAWKVANQPDVGTVIGSALGRRDAGRRTARALGTAHSSSSIVQTTGTIVDTGVLEGKPATGPLRSMRAIAPTTCLQGVDARPLWWVGAGLHVIEVVNALKSQSVKRALPMLGAYTGQTYVGALCTGTHGSGLDHGPLHTAVRAIDLTHFDGAKTVNARIEPSKGNGAITDPGKLPGVSVIQDDGAFRAALVGVGMLGVITGVVVKTVDPYFLQADSVHHTWDEIRALLVDADATGCPKYFTGNPVDGKRYYSGGVLLNPYPRHLDPTGPRRGVISRQWIQTLPPPNHAPPTPAGGCPLLFDLARFLGNHTALTPWFLDVAINSIKDGSNFYGPWSDVLASSGDLPAGYSVEYSLPLATYLSALDDILAEMLSIARSIGMIAGTLSIRFVRGDDAYLSMTEGRDSVFLEFLTLSGIKAAPAVFAQMESVALKHGARPHWGQWFSAGAIAMIAGLYPQLARFRADGAARFDPKGVFANDFSRALLTARGV